MSLNMKLSLALKQLPGSPTQNAPRRESVERD